jgi:glycosyltransferase A (GT-A) superfamily protein (DUF2064 family)
MAQPWRGCATTVLVIMAKEPVMGRVKSRLAADIGPVSATAFQRANLAASALRLALDSRWQTVLAVAPDSASTSPLLPPLPRLPQGPGDLGQRMGRVFAGLPDRDVLIIGADIARVQPRHIARSLSLLRRQGAVLAPSGDGGYWLVGLRAGLRSAGLFNGVRWSTKHALADTAKAFEVALSRKTALGPEHFDVDRGEDFKRWQRGGGMRVVLPSGL